MGDLEDQAVLWTTRLVYLVVAPFVLAYHLLAVLDSFILRVLCAVYAAYGGSGQRVPRIINDGIISVALSVMLVAMMTAVVMCLARLHGGLPLAPGCAS